MKKIILILLFAFISCNKKFDKTKWRKHTKNNEYPFRDEMLNDLIENYNLENKKLYEIIDLLGYPSNYCDQNQYEMGYKIKELENNKLKVLVFELKFDKTKSKIDSLTKISRLYIIK